MQKGMIEGVGDLRIDLTLSCCSVIQQNVHELYEGKIREKYLPEHYPHKTLSSCAVPYILAMRHYESESRERCPQVPANTQAGYSP